MDRHEVVGARLSKLRAQWAAFAQRETARLLVWEAEDDEVALIAGLLEVESNGQVARTPDLFLQLTSPFTDGATHGLTLTSELLAQHAEACDEASDDAWSSDPDLRDDDDVCTLLRVLASFYAHYGNAEQRGKLGVWLDPDEVSDDRAYARWLGRLVACAPDAIRFIVVDAAGDGAPAALDGSAGEQIERVRCHLDVPAALDALLVGAAEPAGVGRFRQLMVRLLNSRADLESARAWAAEATQIGVALGELTLAAVAQMLLAGACCQHQRSAEGLLHFAEAERFGAQHARLARERADAPELPLGAKVQLIAKLGGAALRLSMSEHEAAGRAYLEAAVLARGSGDVGMELECHRLASLCLALDGAVMLAWEVGMHGLQTGLAGAEETRPMPALVQLAAHLSQLTRDCSALHRYAQPLEAHLTRALGDGWRARLDGAAAA